MYRGRDWSWASPQSLSILFIYWNRVLLHRPVWPGTWSACLCLLRVWIKGTQCETGSPTTWDSWIWLHWLAGELHGSDCLYFPNTGITDKNHHAWIFTWLITDQLWRSHLPNPSSNIFKLEIITLHPIKQFYCVLWPVSHILILNTALQTLSCIWSWERLLWSSIVLIFG